jgi:ribulose-phosphate 3-epimerase
VNVRLAPSILAADFAALGSAIAAAERGGADLIHVDVHLMITDPDRYIVEFVEAGASMISVHVEVLPHLHRTIGFIKSQGVKAGVALNPSTPVVAIEEVAADLDYVLVMTVNPGFGGQTFIPRSPSKVKAVRALLDRLGNAAPIEVDGGIDLHTVGAIVAAGAEILVVGSAVFHGRDPEAAARELKSAALAVLDTRASGR